VNDVVNSLLIATCGNIMASDDAFGPMVARDLRQIRRPEVEVVELDIRPASLLDHLPGHRGLILVDAVRLPGHQPGHLIDIDWFSPGRPPLVNDDTMSTHGLSLASQIQLARKLGLLPGFVRLIGYVLADPPRVGLPPAPGLVRQVVNAADLIRRHADVFNAEHREPAYA